AQPGGGLAWAAFWGGLGGMLPDVEVAVAHLFFQGRMRHLYPSHTGLPPHRQVAPPLGIWTQAIAFAGALARLLIRLAMPRRRAPGPWTASGSEPGARGGPVPGSRPRSPRPPPPRPGCCGRSPAPPGWRWGGAPGCTGGWGPGESG